VQIRRTISIPATSTVANVLTGLSPEFAAEDSILTLAATVPAAAAGVMRSSLRLTDEVVMDDAVIGVEAAAGRGPLLPDDVLLGRQPVARGDHLILSATNTSAGAVVLTYILSLDPV
jgi:hypothetical protein